MSELKIINAPAGSGKSTEIKLRVREWAAHHPHDKMLCVTFTNRAADELKAELSTQNVDVSTIHSFLGDFARSLFKAPEVVDLFFEIYAEQIERRIDNTEGKEHIEDSNARYREELGGPLTLKLIAASVDSLSYNERPFNTLYRGGLSHDDLLSFIGVCGKRFPAVYRRVNSKYSQIIIDEYQDTNVEVLDFFVSAVKGSKTSLHLYGDRMQQIYQPGSHRFNEILAQFDAEDRTVTNYRSTPAIVSVLNNIYNDASIEQQPSSTKSSSAPKFHLAANPAELESSLSNGETLVLSVHNSTIFRNLGAPQLLRVMQAMPDHGFSSRYPAVSVLTEREWDRVRNPLLCLLYGLLYLEDLFALGSYGSMIKTLRSNPKVFGFSPISRHEEKGRLRKEFERLFLVMQDGESSIGGVVKELASLGYLNAASAQYYLENESYAGMISVPFAEVRSVYAFNQAPTRSTQHGVKGESHRKVLFIAQTSNSTPVVHMDKLFNVWPRIPINLHMLEEFSGRVNSEFDQAIAAINFNLADMKLKDYTPISEKITLEARRLVDTFSESRLFDELYADAFTAYLQKPNVGNAKKLFKPSAAEGLLAAYRLFYVGCSRAREELDVIVDLSKIIDADATVLKLQTIGFDVVVHS